MDSIITNTVILYRVTCFQEIGNMGVRVLIWKSSKLNSLNQLERDRLYLKIVGLNDRSLYLILNAN